MVRLRSLTATSLGLGPAFVPQIAHAMETKPRTPVLWLHGLECTCCSESFIRSAQPLAKDVVLSMISLDYDEGRLSHEHPLTDTGETRDVVARTGVDALATTTSEAGLQRWTKPLSRQSFRRRHGCSLRRRFCHVVDRGDPPRSSTGAGSMSSLTPNDSALRQRMIDDMRIRKFNGKTQIHSIHAERRLAAVLKRSPDAATRGRHAEGSGS